MIDVVKSTQPIDPQPYPVGLDHYTRERVKHSKTKYTPAQTHHLKKYFLQSPTLDPNRRIEIAKKTGLEEHQVQRWFQNRRHMEQKTQRRLASARQSILPLEAPANYAMTMDPGELSAPGEHNIPTASDYDDPWIVGGPNASFAEEHDYWSQFFDACLLSGMVPNPWDSSSTSEPQDHTHTQLQPSDYKSDEEKLQYSNKSFSPPSSCTDTDPLLDVGTMEQTTTPDITAETPPDLQNFPVYCEMCDYTFTRHQDLRRHLKTDPAHSEEKYAQIWECFYCRFRSKRADAWKRHMANIHATEACLLRVLPDGTMVERRVKKRLLAISSEPFQYDKMYNGRYFRVKRY